MHVDFKTGMPRSQCYDCGNIAARFWGRIPTCNRCIRELQEEDPDAHKCSKCKQEMRPQCLWNGGECYWCMSATKRLLARFKNKP